MVSISVEGYESEQKTDNDGTHGGDDDDDQEDGEEKDNNDCDYDGLDDIQDTMEIDRLRSMGMEKSDDANQNQNTKGRSACVLDQDDRAGGEFQSPGSIAHLYVGKEEEVQSESDSDQTKRWAELLIGIKG
jgi:hypothetical protein